jgi:hypothetical protein
MGPVSEKERLPRPRLVTLASVMAVVGSLVLVVSLVDTLGRLRTPETRRTIDDFLAEPPGDALGLETAQVVDVMQVLAYVSGVLAAVTLVLGVFVAQRHHGARIGLTVAAALLLLTVPVAGLMPFFVAISVGLLWSRQARDWFAGRPPAPAGPRAALSESGPPPSPFPYGAGGSSSGPDPWRQPEPRPTEPTPLAAQAPWQGHPAGSWPAPPQRPGKRPTTVTTAAVLTWLGAGATAALAALTGVVVAVAPDAVVEEFDRISEQSGADLVLSRQEILATAWASVAILLVWSLAAILLAVLAFRRSNAGRILLAISAAMTALFSLVSILSLIPIVTLLMGLATVVLLFTGGANAWYRREPRSWDQQQWSPPPGQQPWSPQPPGRDKPW